MDNQHQPPPENKRSQILEQVTQKLSDGKKNISDTMSEKIIEVTPRIKMLSLQMATLTQAQLIKKLQSRDNATSLAALSILRERGWINLENVNLSGANLQNADLSGVNFILKKANLCQAKLEKANFEKSMLDFSNLEYCSLKEANLTDASLDHAFLKDTCLRDAKLIRAILTSANFINADLRYADLRSAIMRNANLQGADLRYAILESVDLTNANLLNAQFSNADWKPNAQIQPKLPDGSDYSPESLLERFTDQNHPQFWSPPVSDSLSAKSTNSPIINRNWIKTAGGIVLLVLLCTLICACLFFIISIFFTVQNTSNRVDIILQLLSEILKTVNNFFSPK